LSIPYPVSVVPLAQPPVATVRVPGSKSITNRALVLAALAGREHMCVLHNVLRSEDTEVMMACLRTLGFQVQGDGSEVTVNLCCSGDCGAIPAKLADLFVANSGTTMRFLTALVSLGRGRYRLDGAPRMRERPIGDLLDALRQLGVRAYSENDDSLPPVIVEACGLDGGAVTIKGDVSSQFLSGLLMAAPLARGDVTIQVGGRLVSEPYVAMTVAMMRQFGANVETNRAGRFFVPGRQGYQARSYQIEPDASAASYFFAAAAITGGAVTIPDLTVQSLQGDARFAYILEQMGCQLTRDNRGITVHGGALHGVDVDMNAVSDTVMTLAAVACFAEGPTTIRNVAHIRYKETDRLAAVATELRRAGAGVEELADGLIIRPAPLNGATFETYNDHRMAMSLALLGLRVSGVRIANPGCVSKTYPEFFADLERLRPNSGQLQTP
jgi:3-phosphoshikimate 1-carboxyvinyltransferase